MYQRISARTSDPATILVAQGDDDARGVLCDALLLRGFQVGAVNNGARALSLLLSDQFDAAVVDLLMPGMSGLSIIEELRRKKRNIPAVLINAYFRAADVNRWTGVGAVVRKSFDLEVLVNAVETAVSGAG